MGVPAVAAFDAQLGRPVYTFQYGEVASGPCGAEGRVLWRAVGPQSLARGQTGRKTQQDPRLPSFHAVARLLMPQSRVRISWDPSRAQGHCHAVRARRRHVGAPEVFHLSVRGGEWIPQYVTDVPPFSNWRLIRETTDSAGTKRFLPIQM